MRNFPTLLLFSGLFATSGCATQKALDKTQSGMRWNKKPKKTRL